MTRRSVVERLSDIPDAAKLMSVMAKNKAPVFGLEPAGVQSFLRSSHLDLIVEVGNADYQAGCLKPMGRKPIVSDCERVVQASVSRADS